MVWSSRVFASSRITIVPTFSRNVGRRKTVDRKWHEAPASVSRTNRAFPIVRHESTMHAMQRVLEILLGLKRGFLGHEGDLSLQFNPRWPGQSLVGPVTWNVLLAGLALWLVIHVYRREGRSRIARLVMGTIRLSLLAMILVLLNRPIITLTESRTEPSVLAVMIDDSLSMGIPDVQIGEKSLPRSRLDSALALLGPGGNGLLRALADRHQVRLYRFDQDAFPLASISNAANPAPLAPVTATGAATQIPSSLLTVLNDLQGQRLAGVVLLTDGRDTPEGTSVEALKAIKAFGTRVFAIAVGGQKPPINLELQSFTVQDSAFKGDIINVKAVIRGTGFEADHPVKVSLRDQKTGALLPGPDGKLAEATATLHGDAPITVEVPLLAVAVGTLDLQAEVLKEPGEIDDADNRKTAQVAVLDAKINVLYVDGYPRWEYRYLKNQMIRDKTVEISCLLTSADATFAQEGDRPITRFPENMTELMDYDVVLFGDVEARQFSDRQLQLISEFVSKKGGGFGMVSGPKFSPSAYKNTPIEAVLPVSITRSAPDENVNIIAGFRPIITRLGAESSIFRFFSDRQRNEKFLKDEIPPIFWYARGVSVKPGVGESLADHPGESGPDGRSAPILVLGRFGAGRTLFSAIDDSWRWRFYTGESIFDTYWVQQLRYLARSRKLGQRKVVFTASRASYDLGEQVRLSLRILDAQLIGQLPEQIRVEMKDDGGQTLRVETLYRQDGSQDAYMASFTADKIGHFAVILPAIASGLDMISLPLEVQVPRLELSRPEVDRASLRRLAAETEGVMLEYADAGQLPNLIPSAARVVPIYTTEPLWNAPLAMALFVLLVTAEWVLRKVHGMI